MSNEESFIRFLTENTGPGDHAIISLNVNLFESSEITSHSVNLVNIDGNLKVFDVLLGDYQGKPLTKFLTEGTTEYSVLRVGERSSFKINFPVREDRSYLFPNNSKIIINGKESP